MSSIAPTSGLASGGTALGIVGTTFVSGATAKVGGVAATGVVVTNGSLMSATVPALSPGTLDDVTVTNPGNLSGTLAKGWFADFLDVPQSNLFHGDIEKVFRAAITAGCGGGNYCPSTVVSRAQMAVFLLKAEHGSGYAPPACTGLFGDVPCPSPYANWIERLSNEGITAGCGGGNYCPSVSVTRAQMAVFLLKTQQGPSYAPPGCTGVFGRRTLSEPLRQLGRAALPRGHLGRLRGRQLLSGRGHSPGPDGHLPGADLLTALTRPGRGRVLDRPGTLTYSYAPSRGRSVLPAAGAGHLENQF